MTKYDRDAAVAAVTSFYEFFATLPTSTPTEIIYPPPGGWPDITQENLAPLGKNADVIDLYKHLPYLNSGNIEIAPKTAPTWWFYQCLEPVFSEPGGLESLSPFGAGEIPEDVAILTEGHRYGSWLFLDTKNGKFGSFRCFYRLSSFRLFSRRRLYREGLIVHFGHNYRSDPARISRAYGTK